MKKTTLLTIGMLVGLVAVFGCSPKAPVQTDGDDSYQVVVYDTTGLYNPADSTKMTPVANATVVATSQEYVKQYTFQTDANGRVMIEDVIASNYRIDARFPISKSTILKGTREVPISGHIAEVDTIFTKALALSPLLINEIYYCGPQNNLHFFFDQYIELINRSDSVLYLDGMILTRIRSSSELIPIKDTLSYVQNVYAFKFPGSPGDTRYPIYPGERKVIATDAKNHSSPTIPAVDLSHADFEFFNQYKSDYDNPEVPNLTNLIPNGGVDFYISLVHDGVVLADGTEYELVTVATSTGDKVYLNIPLKTILDGVEYGSLTSTKALTIRLDSGIAGDGVQKYSGKSIQRANPQEDTNNSTVDFVVLPSPTPGY
ncbi:MAG: hypothetical protein Kow0037_07550 [Calditrichia bacterium]